MISRASRCAVPAAGRWLPPHLQARQLKVRDQVRPRRQVGTQQTHVERLGTAVLDHLVDVGTTDAAAQVIHDCPREVFRRSALRTGKLPAWPALKRYPNSLTTGAWCRSAPDSGNRRREADAPAAALRAFRVVAARVGVQMPDIHLRGAVGEDRVELGREVPGVGE